MATGTNNIASVYNLWSTLDTLGDLSSTKTALTSVYGTYSSTAAPETKNQWGTGLCPSKASWLKLNDYNTNGIVEISGTYTNDQLVKYTDLIYKYLKLSVSTWNPSSSAETKTISVICSGSFTISSDQNWLTVSSASGSGSKNITLSVTENTSIESFRSGVVTFVGDGITKKINVRQDARDAVIAYELEISGETSVLVNKTIQLTATLYKTVDGVRTESTNVTNDCNWTVSFLPEYASVNNVSNKGLVTGLKNTYSSQATIKATYSSYSATYKISVANDVSYTFVITSDVDEIQVGSVVTFTATLYTNTNGTVTESRKTYDSTWTEDSNGTIVEKDLFEYYFKGVSVGEVTITATWTNSNGVVYSDSKSIIVKAANSIDVSPISWTVPVNGGSQIVTVTADSNWAISEILDWVTADNSSGTGNGSITLSATANNSVDSRSGYVKFTCGNAKASIWVYQSGKSESSDSISINPTSWTNISANGAYTYIAVTSSGIWSITSKPDWITPLTSIGVSGDNVKLTASANSNSSVRIGKVVFTCGTATAELTVSQAGVTITDSISINPTNKTLTSNGGSFDVTVTSSGTWIATESYSWITLSKSSGSTGNTVTITVNENTTTSNRVGSVIFKCGTAAATLTITQFGREPILTMTINNLQSIVSSKWGEDGLDDAIVFVDDSGNRINVGLTYDLYYFEGDCDNTVSGLVSSWESLYSNYGYVYLGDYEGIISDALWDGHLDTIYEYIADAKESCEDKSFSINWPVRTSSITTYELEVTPTSSGIDIGASKQLTAKYWTVVDGVRTTSVNVTNYSTCTWTSSDSTLASVNKGYVTGIKPGVDIEITATYNGKSDTVWIEVLEPKTISIPITFSADNWGNMGQECDIVISVQLYNSETEDIIPICSNKHIVVGDAGNGRPSYYETLETVSIYANEKSNWSIEMWGYPLSCTSGTFNISLVSPFSDRYYQIQQDIDTDTDWETTASYPYGGSLENLYEDDSIDIYFRGS